jgi:hypothetical protein
MNDGGEEAAQEAASPRGRTARSIYLTEQLNSSPVSHRQDTRGGECHGCSSLPRGDGERHRLGA